jgi:nitrogen fixation protein NifU and related proteins
MLKSFVFMLVGDRITALMVDGQFYRYSCDRRFFARLFWWFTVCPYSATLLDHFHSPRNVGVLPAPDSVGYADLNGNAPRVTLYLNVERGRIANASFVTFGCGVMIACCSMITELVKGRSLKACMTLIPADLVDALAGVPQGKEFCADLCVTALSRALAQLNQTS